MALCNGKLWPPTTGQCSREFWAAVVPSALVLLLLLSGIPLPARVRRILAIAKRPFINLLTLPEAEALDIGQELGEDPMPPVPLWRGLLISCFSLFEALFWSAFGSFALIADSANTWDGLRPFLIASTWLYATSRPFTRPTATPPFDLFALFTLHLVFGVIVLGGLLFDYQVQGLPPPSSWVLAGHLVNLIAIASLLLLVLSMPLAVPSKRVNKKEIVRPFPLSTPHDFLLLIQGKSISPEDYTSLWAWMSFTWIRPLIKRVCA